MLPVVSLADENDRDWFTLPPLLMETTYKIQCGASLGTAFILGHPTTVENESYYVLITAKHVLEAFKEDKATLHLRKYVNDHYERFPIQLTIRKNGKPLWVTHPGADIAALRPIIPQSANIRSIRLLSTGLLADDKMLKEFELQPGDELMALGFPFGAESNEAGFPILRSGRVASYPLLPTSLNKTFLLDFEVFKGNSGGPVFLYDRNRFYGDKVHFGRTRFIAGLVSKEQELTEKIQSLEQVTVKKHRLSLAIIVHAKLIRETIEILFPEIPIPEPTEKDDT